MRALALGLVLTIALLACGDWSYCMTTYSGADSFPASFTLPDDASPPTAAQVNPALEALGDRTKYLYQRTSILSHVLVVFQHAEDTAQSTTFGSSFTAVSMPGLQPGGGQLFSVPGLQVGDIVETEVNATVIIQGTSGAACLATFELQESQNGGAATVVPASVAATDVDPGAANGVDVPVRIRGTRQIGQGVGSGGGTGAGTYQVQLFALAGAASGPGSAHLLAGSASATIKVYRPAPGL